MAKPSRFFSSEPYEQIEGFAKKHSLKIRPSPDYSKGGIFVGTKQAWKKLNKY